VIAHLRDELSCATGDLLEMHVSWAEEQSRWAEREADIADQEEYVRQLHAAIAALGRGAPRASLEEG
jgi:hypothetical protein